MKPIRRLCVALLVLWILCRVSLCCAQVAPSVQDTMDAIVTRMYGTLDAGTLARLDDAAIQTFITPEERRILATKYWCFDANEPVIVSVMRDTAQPVAPFWLIENGFQKTDGIVRNEHYEYEVWRKSFAAGRVELGINGFDKHRPHYFVCAGPQNAGGKLELTNFFPLNQHVSEMRKGALTYHDWTELVITELPKELEGQILLTTIRGRARGW